MTDVNDKPEVILGQEEAIKLASKKLGKEITAEFNVRIRQACNFLYSITHVKGISEQVLYSLLLKDYRSSFYTDQEVEAAFKAEFNLNHLSLEDFAIMSPFRKFFAFEVDGDKYWIKHEVDNHLQSLASSVKKEEMVESLKNISKRASHLGGVLRKEAEASGLDVENGGIGETVIAAINYAAARTGIGSIPEEAPFETDGPMTVVTSMFRPLDILYRENGFVVASGVWASGKANDIACRWHEPGKLGYPSGKGLRHWMRLPVSAIDCQVGLDSLTLTFKNMLRDSIHEGSWVIAKINDEYSSHLVRGKNGNIVTTIGLADRGYDYLYSIAVSDIVNVYEQESLLRKFHQNRILIWLGANGQLYVTYPFKLNSNVYMCTHVAVRPDTMHALRPKWSINVSPISIGYLSSLKDWVLIKELSNLADLSQALDEINVSPEYKQEDLVPFLLNGPEELSCGCYTIDSYNGVDGYYLPKNI